MEGFFMFTDGDYCGSERDGPFNIVFDVASVCRGSITRKRRRKPSREGKSATGRRIGNGVADIA